MPTRSRLPLPTDKPRPTLEIVVHEILQVLQRGVGRSLERGHAWRALLLCLCLCRLWLLALTHVRGEVHGRGRATRRRSDTSPLGRRLLLTPLLYALHCQRCKIHVRMIMHSF